MSKKFQKTIENFTCENCGFEVEGDGYTNHCPKCLWSKHVDIYPGDRASECGGEMSPMGYEKKGGETQIIHVCKKCGHKKKNKMSPEDDFDVLIDIKF